MGRFRLLTAIGFAFCLGFLGAACTKSHDVGLESASLLGGSGAMTASAGRSAGRGGGMAPRAGGPAAGTGVTTQGCGNCPAGNLLGFVMVPACCAGTKCGLDISTLGLGSGCSESNAPGQADPSCPGSTVGGFAQLEGCCRPDGTCGALDTFLGLGCAVDSSQPVTPCKPK